MDSLGVEYDYEPEGFVVDGLPYLPDFWLPEQNCWVEIRPAGSTGMDPKCEALARLSGKRVLYVAGQPYPGEYRITVYPGYEEDEGVAWVFATGRRDPRELWLYAEDYAAICLNPITDDDRWPLGESKEIMAAYAAGRQARFEHGANP